MREARDRINEERQRNIEAQLDTLRQVQAIIDEHERDLREHRARQIEEFRRTNEELLREMHALSEDRN